MHVLTKDATPVSRHRCAVLSLFLLCTVVCGTSSGLASLKPVFPRQSLNLDGQWQIEQGSLDAIPSDFTHTVSVPGLVDMAKPTFSEVGVDSHQRQAFWYRRQFVVDGPVPGVALLKVHKARYGTKVWLNGQPVGEHLPCFTPGYFNLKPHLRGEGQNNELVIRVGAHRNLLPLGMPTGWDFEKYLYIPGIYDSVEVILTRSPHIVNIQTVPDILRNRVRVVTDVGFTGPEHESRTMNLHYTVREARSGKLVCSEQRAGALMPTGQSSARIETELSIDRARHWSPEDPFLYELIVSNGSDAVRTRFGMRTFGFEPGGKYALLNGKRYFLRGSNFTTYRFFEDAERGDKPWRADWVRRLHRKVKGMHWNSLRYCIGFPPDFWYDIADEEGILIQDEFPIWTLGEDPEKLQADKIIPEYTEWMQERWNHPCVVIWDAQNESSIKATGEALRAVRALDLSNRPWENGWGEPQAPTDCTEAHPYLMIGLFNPAWGNSNFAGLKDMPNVSGKPPLNPEQRKIPVPIIINEYAWLWLTRNGEPTCLTGPVYEKLLGAGATVAQRRTFYAKTLAAKTEFWRAHRECAGVLHFCTLGYSRPGDQPRPVGGATSDHWIDVEQLKFEPNFERYVRDAFSPIGVMLDFWDDTIPAGSERTVRVYVINDLEPEWKGKVRLRVANQAGKRLSEKVQPCHVTSFGQRILEFKFTFPCTAGAYTLIAELDGKGHQVRSIRDFNITSAQ